MGFPVWNSKPKVQSRWKMKIRYDAFSYCSCNTCMLYCSLQHRIAKLLSKVPSILTLRLFQMFKFALCLLLLVELVSGFQPRSAFLSARHQISKTSLNEIPLELSGQLDPSKVWDVTLEFNGVQKVVSISEGNSILEIAETIFDGTTASFLNV